MQIVSLPRQDDHAVPPARDSGLSVSDAQLVERAASGDRHAISAIWTRHRKLVRSVLLSTLGADPDLDDLVQEVFLGLVPAVKQLRDGKALPALLCRIAIRRAGMTLRRRRVRAVILLLPWSQVPDVEVAPPDVDDRLALQELYRLCKRIARRPRLCFLLHDVQGMTSTEVADALGISHATAKRGLAEGRKKILRLARAEPRLRRFLPGLGEVKP